MKHKGGMEEACEEKLRIHKTGEKCRMCCNRIHPDKLINCTTNHCCNNLKMLMAHKLHVSQHWHVVKKKASIPVRMF